MRYTIFVFFFIFHVISWPQERDSLEIRIATVDDPKEKFEILYKALNTYYNTDMDVAEKYVNRLVSIAYETNDSLLFKAYLEQAFYWYRRGEYKYSLVVYDKADSIAKFLSDREKHARVLYAKARSIYFLGDYIKCNKMFIESAKIQDSLGNTMLAVDAYNGIALVLMEQEKYEEALKYITLAEEKSIAQDSLPPQAIFSTKGIILKELKRYDEAIEFHMKSLAESTRENDLHSIAKDYNNLAAVYGLKNDHKTATELYRNALKIKRDLKDKSGEAITMVGLSNIYSKTGDYDMGIRLLTESLDIAYDVGNRDLLTYIFENLTDLYKQKGDFKSALENKQRQMQVKDSLNGLEFQKEIAQLNIAYETEKKEIEILKQQKELEKNRLTIKNNRLIFLVAALSLLIITIIIYFYFKRMKDKRLKLQNLLNHRQELNRINTKNKLQEQRIRISRDLHDNIGSQLTFIISSTENLQFQSKMTDEKFKLKLQQITQFSKDTINQLRDTIWAMNHDKISYQNFQSRLLSFIDKARMANELINIQLNSKVEQPINFTSIRGINLFRVVQETINNALKHANAKNINIDIYLKDEQLNLLIQDDGIGFDKTTIEQGNGLENMQNRISEIGGKFILKTFPNMGTRVSILFNINTLNAV